MARFSKNTLTEVGGVDGEVLAQEILWGTDTFWNMTITDENDSPYNLTPWNFSCRLMRRKVDAVVDGRNGIELVNLRASPMSPEINLDANIQVYNPLRGQVRLLLDKTFFDAVNAQVDTISPPVYTGYFSAILPASGSGTNYVPQQTKKILLCFIVRSDGIKG